jgi:hypothetical protein
MTFFANLEFKDILLFILIIFILCKIYQLEQKTNMVEGLDDETVQRIIKPLTDEALQSIASIYDDQNLVLPSTTIRGKLVVDDLEVVNKTDMNGDLEVTGKTDLNGGAVIKNFYPNSGVLNIYSPVGETGAQRNTHFGYTDGYNYISSENGTVIRGNSNGLIDKDKNGDTYVKKGDGITLHTRDGSNKPYLSQCCNDSYPTMRSSSWLKTNKANVKWYVS